MKVLIFTIISISMFGTLKAQSITYIDLAHAKFEEIPASRIFENIKYVPLETHTEGLLKIKSVTFYLTDKYIIAANLLGGVYLFHRETGKFIREVSSFGQGPNEYSGYLHNLYGFDEKNKIIFETGSRVGAWKCINIETNKVESIFKKPVSENSAEKFSPIAPWLIKDNIYVSFCNNRTGKDKVRLVVYNKEGTLIKKYPNYLEYDPGKIISMPANNGIFYYYNGRTYFKEWNYNDTVFSVDENKMTPHIIFKLGNKQPSYYHQNYDGYNKGKYFIDFVYESNSFILFNFGYSTETKESLNGKMGKKVSTYTGYYDKKSKQAYISLNSDLKKPGYAATGIPAYFHPVSINKNNEMTAKIDPAELMKYIDKIDSKYKHLFRNIQEDDNPIVIIAKLK